MNKRACIYVTDKGFLVPSLVSALQLYKSGSTKKSDADILFFLLDISDDYIEKLSNSFGQFGMKFISIDNDSLKLPHDISFREGHVPKSTLARLILSKYIPENYENLLYIDGDTQILSDISELIEAKIPEGHIGAINGSLWLSDTYQREWNTKYLNRLGIKSTSDYFNAGVLAFTCKTWLEYGPKTLEFFINNSEACYHHDQSALNAVFFNKRVIIEPAYNYHTEYANLYLHGKYKPKIVHFTGRDKPWLYPVTPWGMEFTQPYIEILSEYPFLLEFMSMPKKISPFWQFVRNVKKMSGKISSINNLIAQRQVFKNYIENQKFFF